jgi:hypothetical protein
VSDPAQDEAICSVLRRLARPHPSGGDVLERAALLAEGEDFPAIMDWIADHHGIPEAGLAPPPSQGLHGSRTSGAGAAAAKPTRYVLPAGILS